MSLIAYGLIALAILSALGGIGYKVREAGADSVRVEWQAANAKAAKDAEAERARQDALREAQDRKATETIAKEKTRVKTLMSSLDAHIRVARLPADCKLTPSLLNDVNSALAGPEGVRPGAVPSTPGAAAATDGPKPRGSAAAPSPSR